MALILAFASLLLWAYENNKFKTALNDKNYFSMTILYFVMLGLGMFVAGLLSIGTDVFSAFGKGYFYLIILIEFVSGIGIGIMFNRSNATFVIALTSASSMIASYFYLTDSTNKTVFLGAVVICLICLIVYFKETGSKITKMDIACSFFFIFLPQLLTMLFMPVMKEDFGNGVGVYGMAMSIPFLILLLFKRKSVVANWDNNNVRRLSTAAAVSIAANYLYFLALDLSSHSMVPVILFILALEAVVTETVGYMMKNEESLLDLGSKSKLQFASIALFSLLSAVVITL